MNLNLERVRQVIAELEHHRRLIDDALKSLTALEKIFDSSAVDRVVNATAAGMTTPSSTSVAAPSQAEFACVKHPHSREFSARGQCKLCQSEYMKEYWSKKKKMRAGISLAPTPDAGEATAADGDSEESSDYVFSKQQRCPKCGLMTRFRRDRDANPTDYWVCMGGGCELKIGNYRISVDRDYAPALPQMQIS